MKFTVIDAEQRSPEWRRARAGRLTGSRAQMVLTQGRKGSESVQRRDYRLQLVAERIAGEAQDNLYHNAEMERGNQLEPVAFAMYEALHGELVRRTGFLSAEELMVGCSLDGDINEFSGIVELKCPKMSTHLSYLADPTQLQADYFAQVRHNLWVSGAAYCDLISFDDRLPAHRQMLRVRIERYNAQLAEYEAEALKFLKEVDDHYQLIMDGAYS
jgi:predicted phage-related endonuclease